MIEGLFTLLSTAAAVESLAATRIYPVVLPADAVMPAVTYQEVGSQSNPTFDTLGVNRHRVQFDAWGSTYASAFALRKAVVQTLNRFQGALSDGSYVQATEVLQLIDRFESEALQYRCISEFYIWAAVATN